MKKVELICIGDLKFKDLKELEKKYTNKINFFVEFKTKNLDEVKLKDEELIRKREGQNILEQLDKKDFVIVLDRHGKMMDSIKFAKFLSNKISYYSGRIVFVIGGYLGLSESLNSRINLKLSFSEMTFAHDIFRILFLEQLYRSFTIMKGIKYHR